MRRGLIRLLARLSTMPRPPVLAGRPIADQPIERPKPMLPEGRRIVWLLAGRSIAWPEPMLAVWPIA